MSLHSSDDDSQQRFALGFLFALIALVVSTVIGVVVYQRGIAHSGASPEEPAAVDVVIEDAASVVVEDGVVKFYFATGKAELADNAGEVLASVAQGVAAGKRAVISGFHDATGDAALNAELARQRALAVRDALVAQGVALERVELKKPAQTEGSGPAAAARRVEVILLP